MFHAAHLVPSLCSAAENLSVASGHCPICPFLKGSWPLPGLLRAGDLVPSHTPPGPWRLQALLALGSLLRTPFLPGGHGPMPSHLAQVTFPVRRPPQPQATLRIPTAPRGPSPQPCPLSVHPAHWPHLLVWKPPNVGAPANAWLNPASGLFRMNEWKSEAVHR